MPGRPSCAPVAVTARRSALGATPRRSRSAAAARAARRRQGAGTPRSGAPGGRPPGRARRSGSCRGRSAAARRDARASSIFWISVLTPTRSSWWARSAPRLKASASPSSTISATKRFLPASATASSNASQISVLISPTWPMPRTRVLSLSRSPRRRAAGRARRLRPRRRRLARADVAVEDDERVAVAERATRPCAAAMVLARPRLHAVDVSQEPHLAAQPLEAAAEADQRSPCASSSSSGSSRRDSNGCSPARS